VTPGVSGGFKVSNNKAMYFDGSGEIDTALTQREVAAYTVEVWLNTTESPSLGRATVWGGSEAAGRSLTLGLGPVPGLPDSPGSLASFFLDAKGVLIGLYTVAPLNDGKWHQLVGTWTSQSGVPVAPAQFAIYVDGRPATTAPVIVGNSLVPPLTGSGPTKIGRHDAWNTTYRGSLQQVAIFPRALGPVRIQEHYTLATAP
jgi:hypothetical protein